MNNKNNSQIENMLESFKNIMELKAFAEQQHITILELTKKIENLKTKNIHLENLLQQNISPLIGEYKPTIVGPHDENHEESICRMELKKLHDISLERALTFEETKKVEVYTKLLLSINQKPKAASEEVKRKSTSELLRLVSTDNEQ
jgi:hypothetical protein